VLRVRRERPRDRAAEEREELAPPHALPSSNQGTAYYHTISVRSLLCVTAKSILEWQ
jgi:hypothetical protein